MCSLTSSLSGITRLIWYFYLPSPPHVLCATVEVISDGFETGICVLLPEVVICVHTFGILHKQTKGLEETAWEENLVQIAQMLKKIEEGESNAERSYLRLFFQVVSKENVKTWWHLGIYTRLIDANFTCMCTGERAMNSVCVCVCVCVPVIDMVNWKGQLMLVFGGDGQTARKL